MRILSILILLALTGGNLSASDTYRFTMPDNFDANGAQYLNNNHYFVVPKSDLFKINVKSIQYQAIDKISEHYKEKDELWDKGNQAELHYQGIKRRLDFMRVSFPVFKSNGSSDSVLKECIYEIDYGIKLPKTESEINKFLVSAFGGIQNMNDLPNLLSYVDQNRKERILAGESWIDPNLEYLKITTSKDGIAALDAKELIDLMPNWSGKPVSEFQLLYKGAKHPVHFSSASLISGTSIYLKASRAMGDTTWYDNYTSEEPFFLVHNPNDSPQLLNKLDLAASTQKNLNRVLINRHIEEENEYSAGDTVYSHYTLPFEGWYWDIIHKYEKPGSKELRTFRTDLAMSRSDEPLDLKLRYNTQLNFDHFRSDFGITLSINGKLHDSVYVDALGEGFLTNDKNIKLYPGANQLQVISHGIKNDVGRVGIDYLLLSGKVEPFAFDGAATFDIESQNSNFSISVPGFSNKDIMIYDTISKSYSFVNGTAGTSFRANVINGDTKFATIIINDHIYTSEEAGIHIASVDENGELSTSFFTPGNQDAVSEINALSGKSFTVCINKFPLASNIESALKSLSANEIPSDNGMTYILYGKSGNRVEEISKPAENGISDFVEHNDGLSYQAKFDLKANQNYSLVMADRSHFDAPNLYRVDKADIKAQDVSYDAIVLTHTDLLPSAIAYKEFRADKDIKVKIVDVNNIYDIYNYGKKSPHAIKEYLKEIYSAWDSPLPTNVIIIGDANWDTRDAMKLGKTKDLVPTYGWPATDYWYVLMDGPADQIGEFAVGRIPVNSNRQMLDYIEKIRSYDNAEKSPWMKKAMFLSGGEDEEEVNIIHRKSILHAALLQQQPLCADTIHIKKPLGNVVSEAVASKIKNEINNGVQFISFFGHGSPEVFDIEGWQVEKLNNKDRYFSLLSLSCNTGAFAEPYFENCRNESYVVAADKGAISAVGGTGVMNRGHADVWAKSYWEGLIRTNLQIRSFGDIIAYPKSTLSMVPGYIKLRFQMNLLGDPMVDARIGLNPDPYLNVNYVALENENGSTEFTDENQELRISGKIHNYGIAYTDTVVLRLTYDYEGNETSEDIIYNSVLNSRDFSYSIPIKSKPGKYKISLQIDPEGDIENDDISNNTLTFDIDVFKRGLLPLDPLSFWDVKHLNPKFRFINPLEGDFAYNFVISENRGDTSNTVYSSTSDEIIERENYILWNTTASLTKGNNYWVGAKPYSINNEYAELDWLWIPIHADLMQPNKAQYIKKGFNLAAHTLEDVDVRENDGEQQLQLNDRESDFYIVSVKGNYVDGASNRWITLTVDGNTFVDISTARGFNVVTIPKYQNSGKARYKRFDCYRPDIYSDENLENVYAFHNFLRDSVRDDEYLAIGTCDNSMAWQEYLKETKPEDYGSIDTLKKLLRMYGAHHVDSLNTQASYAFFSWKGASEDEAIEVINMSKDTALATGNIIFYQPAGSFTSEQIGPAETWSKIEFEGEDFANSKVKIILHDTLNQKKEYGEFSPDSQIDLSEIDASQYPFLSYKVDMMRENVNQSPRFNKIMLDYKPSPELALVKSSFEIAEDNILRGEKNYTKILVENISGRSSLSSSEVSLGIYKNLSLFEQHNITLSNMSVDGKMLIDREFETENLSENNEVKINANPYKKHFTEVYSFNNAYSKEFSLQEDTIRPTGIVLADNSVIENHSFVAASPLFEVRVYDNSPLDYMEGLEPAIRLNGKYYTEDNSQFYNLEFIHDSEENLKAVLQVRPDTIGFEESLLFAYLIDATGNKDTLKYYLETTQKSAIDMVHATPNPFSEFTVLNFNLISAYSSGSGVIKIFNTEGELVKKIDLESLRVGTNTVTWDGTDLNGRNLPSGAYYFSVARKSEIYTEPAYGKVVLIR